MTRQRMFKTCIMSMLCMVFRGMLTDRTMCAFDQVCKELAQHYDVNAFLSGKTDRYEGFDSASLRP